MVEPQHKKLNESYGLQAMQAPYGKRVLGTYGNHWWVDHGVFFFGPKHLLLPSRSSRRGTAEDYLVSDTDTRSYTEDGSFYIVLLYNWLVGDFNPLDFAAFLER